MSELLPCVVVEPKTSAQATVIWLHGLGADGHDFEAIVPELRLPADLPVRFVFPHAPVQPVTINGGYRMRAWYDILEAKLDRRVDENGVRASADAVAALIENEVQKGIPHRRIVLAGFSQGGAITLFLGLRYPQRLAGLMALSTYLPVPETLAAERSDAMREAPLFMAHGQYDPIVPLPLGEQTRQQIHALGYRVDFRTYPMPHSVCAQEVQDISNFLQTVLKD